QIPGTGGYACGVDPACATRAVHTRSQGAGPDAGRNRVAGNPFSRLARPPAARCRGSRPSRGAPLSPPEPGFGLAALPAPPVGLSVRPADGADRQPPSHRFAGVSVVGRARVEPRRLSAVAGVAHPPSASRSRADPTAVQRPAAAPRLPHGAARPAAARPPGLFPRLVRGPWQPLE